MKRKLWVLTMLAALLLFCCAARTETLTNQCGADGGNLIWTLDDNGVLTISGQGDMRDGEDYGDSPWEDVKASIREVVIEDGVTSIGDFMFWDCPNLTSVTLGQNVSRIGQCALLYCEQLTEICLPESLELLDKWAFIHCHGLEKVYIPEYANLNENVFYRCDNLTDIYYGGDSDTWESVAYVEDPEDPDDALNTAKVHFLSTVQDYLSNAQETAGGTQQGSVSPQEPQDPDLPGDDEASGSCGSGLRWSLNENGLLTITGTGAMDDYVMNTEIHYDEYGSRYTVTYFTYPWKDVAGQITAVRLTEGVTKIGNMAFSGISSLKTAWLPLSLTRVVYGAFHQSGLTDVYYAGDANAWNTVSKEQYNGPLNGASFHWNAVYEGQLPGERNLNLPADLQVIEESAFENGIFTHVYLGDQVTAIRSRAFAGCRSLEFIYIPATVTAIADDAFEGSSLQTIYSEQGSAAEAFANAHGIDFVYPDDCE